MPAEFPRELRPLSFPHNTVNVPTSRSVNSIVHPIVLDCRSSLYFQPFCTYGLPHVCGAGVRRFASLRTPVFQPRLQQPMPHVTDSDSSAPSRSEIVEDGSTPVENSSTPKRLNPRAAEFVFDEGSSDAVSAECQAPFSYPYPVYPEPYLASPEVDGEFDQYDPELFGYPHPPPFVGYYFSGPWPHMYPVPPPFVSGQFMYDDKAAHKLVEVHNDDEQEHSEGSTRSRSASCSDESARDEISQERVDEDISVEYAHLSNVVVV
jgi:hypothetical protein